MTEKLQLPFDLEASLSGAGQGTTKSAYEEDNVIFSQGEAAHSIFYISKGKVKLTVLSEQGKEAVVAILGSGDFLGEGCIARPLASAWLGRAAPAHGDCGGDDGMLDYSCR